MFQIKRSLGKIFLLIIILNKKYWVGRYNFYFKQKITIYLFIRQDEKKGNITTFINEITGWLDTDFIQQNGFIVQY